MSTETTTMAVIGHPIWKCSSFWGDTKSLRLSIELAQALSPRETPIETVPPPRFQLTLRDRTIPQMLIDQISGSSFRRLHDIGQSVTQCTKILCHSSFRSNRPRVVRKRRRGANLQWLRPGRLCDSTWVCSWDG